MLGNVCLFTGFVSKIIQWFLMKFSIGDYQRLSAYVHCGTYSFSITSMLHEAETQMYQISLNQVTTYSMEGCQDLRY
jgi:hypothetical protein